MLRSLVGSEMCIRDRMSYERALEESLFSDIRKMRSYRDIAAVTKDLPGTCLLYTSDAADDLLCVDLGGRRIIKKKKTQ
mgnify:CR=1 FL=1